MILEGCELGMCWNMMGNGWNYYNAWWLIGFFIFGFIAGYLIAKSKFNLNKRGVKRE